MEDYIYIEESSRGVSQKTWDSWNSLQKKEYIELHPESKYADPNKTLPTQIKPVEFKLKKSETPIKDYYEDGRSCYEICLDGLNACKWERSILIDDPIDNNKLKFVIRTADGDKNQKSWNRVYECLENNIKNLHKDEPEALEQLKDFKIKEIDYNIRKTDYTPINVKDKQEQMEAERIDNEREENKNKIEEDLKSILKDKTIQVIDDGSLAELTNKSMDFTFKGEKAMELLDRIGDSTITYIDGDVTIEGNDFYGFNDGGRDGCMNDKIIRGVLTIKHNSSMDTLENIPSCDELHLEDVSPDIIKSNNEVSKLVLTGCDSPEIDMGDMDELIATHCGQLNFTQPVYGSDHIIELKGTKIKDLCAINYSDMEEFDGSCLGLEGVELDLHGCYNLCHISSLPNNITNLDITGCRQLDIDDIENLDAVLDNIKLINGTVYCSDCNEELQDYIKSKLDPLQVIATTIDDL